jgi:inner membrane protein
MPSSVAHAMIAVAVGSAVAPRPLFRRFLIVGAACAVLPDIDAIGRLYGSGGDITALGGHRGFTHSLVFAALLGSIAAFGTVSSERWRGHRVRFAAFVALVTASHGILDTLTSIGAETSPVQFLSPFSKRGYTASWHPIEGPFSELFLCLVPLVVFTRTVCHLRGIPWPRRKTEPPSQLALGGADGTGEGPLGGRGDLP